MAVLILSTKKGLNDQFSNSITKVQGGRVPCSLAIEFDGLILDRISPKVVEKEAFQAKYIDQFEVWLEMLNDRNLLSHSYDLETFEAVIPEIKSVYAPLLASLVKNLAEIS